MQQREVISRIGERTSRVVGYQGGFRLEYGLADTCGSECFFLDEQAAHRAAKAWERDGVEPRAAVTLVGLQPIDLALDAAAEQLEACRV